MVQEKVDSGLYSDQAEVIREGLRLLSDRDRVSEAHKEALRRSVAQGLQEAEAGLLKRGKEVLSKLRRDLESRI